MVGSTIRPEPPPTSTPPCRTPSMKATRAAHVGLFLLSASVLALEIALTRIFSLMLWSHYSFLVISTALLGFGAAGSLLSIRRHAWSEEESRRFLARNCLFFAISVVATLMTVTQLGVNVTLVFTDLGQAVRFLAMYALMAIPFFFAGLTICHLLSACSAQINTIYFADLLGAGAGALSVTWLLNSVGAPGTISVSCACAIGAALLFAGLPRVRSINALAAAVALVVTVGSYIRPLEVPVEPSKPLRGQEDKVVETRWSLHGRIDVLESEKLPLSFGSGVTRKFFDRPAFYRTFYMDGGNPSRLIRYDQDHWFFPYLITAGPYALGMTKPHVAIIGSGGGVDTMMALNFDAAEITALEINPVTVDMVRGTFGEYIGGIFERPNVRLIASEGRHFFSLDENRYDVIRLTGVDTQAAAAVGANAFDHAYIYTVEAVQDFWNHLSEGGVLAINRPNGWQSQRLTNVFLAAAEGLGLSDAPARLVAVTNGRWSDILFRRRPYQEQEVESLMRWAEQGAIEVLYDPFHPRDNEIARLIGGGAEAREAVAAATKNDIRPISDDSPFFMEGLTLGTVLRRIAGGDFAGTQGSGFPQLLLTLVQAIVLSALFILLPLRLGGRAIRKTPGHRWIVGYFAALGMGFILAELVYIQKYMILLGGPAYAMSITLFSILVFSGLGAFTANKIPLASPRALIGVFAAVLGLLAASALFLRWGMPYLLGFGFGTRVLLSILSLAPVSFAMGLPFPTGIRILNQSAPDLIPWAWASNACLTVIGSVLCMILSVQAGFSFVLALAAGCYVIAALCLARLLRAIAVVPRAR